MSGNQPKPEEHMDCEKGETHTCRCGCVSISICRSFRQVNDAITHMMQCCTIGQEDTSAAAVAAPRAAHSPSRSSSSSGNNEQKKLAALLGQMKKEWKKKPKVGRQFSSEKQEDEHKGANLFKKMQDPNIKRMVFDSCRRLHDQFVNYPSDYDGFFREYTAFTAHLRQKQKALDDKSSAEGQALRMEQLRLEECDRIYKHALDSMPETFHPVQLLYIRIVVAGCPGIAIVDSAAQISLMSLAFAKRAGLERRIDTRDQSRISGMGGPEKLEGIIYWFELMIGDSQFDTRASIWRGNDDMLIGLDFLLRYPCSIDLARRRLTFTETTYAEFLTDEEVKEYKKDRNDHVHHSFKIDEEKLNRVVQLGFATADAEKALTDFANDETDTIRYLYSVAARARRAAEGSEQMEQ